MNFKRKIIRLFLCCAAALCAVVVLPSAVCAENNAAAADVTVTIVTEAPAPGKPLETAVSGDTAGLSYVWTVAGQVTDRTASFYVPGAADYEAFIAVALVDADGTAVAEDRIFFSRLPVMYIDTDDGSFVEDKWKTVGADVRITGNAEFGAQYEGRMEIKRRGTGSALYGKKPYKIKLDKKTDLFGFGKNKHFILLADYLDPTLLRNAVGYDVSREMGLVASDYMRVDVVMNGEYRGSYLLGEHLRPGKQFVDITDWEGLAGDLAKAVAKANPADFPEGEGALDDHLSSHLSWMTEPTFTYEGRAYTVADYISVPALDDGFLLEFDTGYDREETYFKTASGLCVDIIKPEFLGTNPAVLAYVQTLLDDFLAAVASPDGYNEKGQHYTELADLDSMVAYWLTLEFLANDDSASRSRVCYVQNGKIVFGPVWDFDISAGSYRSVVSPRGRAVTKSFISTVTRQDLFRDWVQHPEFREAVRAKYLEKRAYFGSLVSAGGIIEAMSEAQAEATLANETLWCGGEEGKMPRTFSGPYGDYAIYLDFLRLRLAWFDEVFDVDPAAFPAEPVKNAENAVCADGCHTLSHVPFRAATADRFGMRECFYCNTCLSYFDAEGNRLSPYDVLIPTVTADRKYGLVLHYVNEFVELCIILSFFAAGGILLAQRKKLCRHRER